MLQSQYVTAGFSQTFSGLDAQVQKSWDTNIYFVNKEVNILYKTV